VNIFYDFSYFLSPDLGEKFQEAAQKIKSEIERINGVIVEDMPPMKKNLNYPILKRPEGLFGSIKFLAEPEKINILNSALKKNADILRFFIQKRNYKETAPVYKRRVTPTRKEKPAPKQTKEQISEIDKKLDEILGI